ncbi:MAG TPA: hypothetical protein PLL11_17225 [Spirochaetota bacterium]|nr:hypothetical protein [Spirochaetota bacterium]
MITMKVTGVEELQKRLDKVSAGQLPFAMALALTRTAQDAKDALVKEMRAVFDRPTPYTLSSHYVKAATKRDLSAKVYLKEFAGKGTPAGKYLGPEIMGGHRGLKRFEMALRRVGLLPEGRFVVPGSACPMDAYGNVQRSVIVQVLSYLQAFGEQGYKANITEARKARLAKGNRRKQGFVYFVSRGRGTLSATGRMQNLPAGIWKRTSFAAGSAVQPIFMFVKTPTYAKRYNFYEVAHRVAKSNFAGHFREAWREALATAK